MNTVITIGHQFGSAGREIGEQVARNLELNIMIRSCFPGSKGKLVL